MSILGNNIIPDIYGLWLLSLALFLRYIIISKVNYFSLHHNRSKTFKQSMRCTFFNNKTLSRVNLFPYDLLLISGHNISPAVPTVTRSNAVPCDTLGKHRVFVLRVKQDPPYVFNTFMRNTITTMPLFPAVICLI